MQIVEDDDGCRYVLEKAAQTSWLVRDPQSGERHHRPPGELRVVAGASPLELAGETVPDDDAAQLPISDRQSLGLLAEIRSHEPVGVRTLLGTSALCESDLHGLLGELVAAGLIRETTVAGERGYETTERVEWDP